MGTGICLNIEVFEQHLCWNHLFGSLVQQRVTTAEETGDPKRLEALERNVSEIQSAMKADPESFADLLPVLRGVRKERDDLKKQSVQVVLESVDPHAVDNCLLGFEDSTSERRGTLREMIRDTVARIDIIKIEGSRRNLVTGKMQLTSGKTRAVRFAYDCQRQGVVPCDGTGDRATSSNVFAQQSLAAILPQPLSTTRLNDEVLVELPKLPLRRVRKNAKQPVDV